MATRIKDDWEGAPRPGTEDEPAPRPLPLLHGLRVIEGSAFVAAPLGGMTLAQLGAEVIRFDPIGGGLDYERWPVTADGASLFWAGLNKGKRSIAIDLGRPEGVEIATRLITADGADRGIFLTNFPARGWLDYDRLAGMREDLIMVNVTGDHTGRSEVDYTVNAAIGFPMVTGPRDAAGPVNHVLPAWDVATGVWAALAIVAAERHRRETGGGRLLTLPLADVALAVTGALGLIGEVMINGADRERHGNDLFGGFGRDFETGDGRRIMVVGLTARQWRGLMAATGLEAEMAALGDRLSLDLARQGNRFIARDEIAAFIAPWIAARSLTQCAEAFDANGVCWGPYQSFRELVESDPRCSTANPMFDMIEQPGIGTLLAPGAPLAEAGGGRPPARPAPLLGADTDAVLSEVLGLSEGEIGRLHDSGVVAGPGAD
ncbi:MAG: CoA transferase [Alphaproteobacteria bacterium]|nr:CoA transferase [Alphaproteobacteria bacterium]